MSLIVGKALDSEDTGGLELGTLLARSLDRDMVVVGVLTHRWSLTSPSRDEVTRTARHREAADRMLSTLLVDRPGDVRAGTTLRVGRSVPTELHEEAVERGAEFLVLGSADDAVRGRIALGAVTDRVLHSAPVPVAIAPRGYRVAADARVPRLTVAVDGGPRSAEVVAHAAAIAARAGVGVRLVTFAIRRKAMFPPELGLAIEDDVVAAWCDQARDAQGEAVAAVAARPDAADLAPVVERAVVVGRSWEHAVAEMDWLPGELLVIGSSTDSALTRVFLGSTATRLLKAAETPVVVVPE